MKINIKEIQLKNFLSVGNKWLKIDFREGLYRVTGENLDKNTKNGVGKCVDGDTITNIFFNNEETKRKFENFINNG